ncbi:hypothetical protein LINPERPRIM_LOCUS36364 [Linum perenne]
MQLWLKPVGVNISIQIHFGQSLSYLRRLISLSLLHPPLLRQREAREVSNRRI